jgi:hypothetical protein
VSLLWASGGTAPKKLKTNQAASNAQRLRKGAKHEIDQCRGWRVDNQHRKSGNASQVRLRQIAIDLIANSRALMKMTTAFTLREDRDDRSGHLAALG